MKKHGIRYSSTSPARIPPQLRSPAFWISTAPRPPARLAPQAIATASSSRATSTVRIVADFIGASSILRGRATTADEVRIADGLRLRVAGSRAFAPGSEVEVAIRPERVQLATAQRDNVLEGRIVRLSYQGALTEVTTEVAGGQRLLAFVTEPAPAPLATGQTVRLHLPPDAFTVL